MIRQVMQAIRSAAEKLAERRSIVAISFALYVVWIGILYLFVATRDASVLQLVRTLVLAVAAIALFFILQVVGVSYTRETGDVRKMVRRAMAGWWKLLAISVPFLLLAWLIDAGLERLVALIAAQRQVSPAVLRGMPGAVPMAIRWTGNLLLYFLLPVAAIHLWILTEQGRLRAGLRNLWRGFAPRFLLVYALIVAVFGSLAYAVAVTRTPAGNAWLEIGLFSARLIVVAVVIFSGWLLTLGALSELNVVKASETSSSK